jgi:Ala-tRNA(Pro) deacylase
LEIAESSHIHGRNFAKVVMIKVEGELGMMVLPAHYHVALDILKAVLAVESIELAAEKEFSYRFPRCELGAMPPFGHLFGLQTYMVPVFEEAEDIAFNAGSHTELVRMPLEEYLRVAYVTEVAGGVMPPSKPSASTHHHRSRSSL